MIDVGDIDYDREGGAVLRALRDKLARGDIVDAIEDLHILEGLEGQFPGSGIPQWEKDTITALFKSFIKERYG